jgi:hypothetical protein
MDSTNRVSLRNVFRGPCLLARSEEMEAKDTVTNQSCRGEARSGRDREERGWGRGRTASKLHRLVSEC